MTTIFFTLDIFNISMANITHLSQFQYVLTNLKISTEYDASLLKKLNS